MQVGEFKENSYLTNTSFKDHLQVLADEAGNITELANRLGVSPSTVSRILSGASTGSRDLAEKVLDYLKVDSKITPAMIKDDIVKMPPKTLRTSVPFPALKDITNLTKREELMKNACRDKIVNELLRRTSSVMMINTNVGFFNADLAIRTDILSKDRQLKDWYFVIIGDDLSVSPNLTQNAVKKLISLIGCAHLFQPSKPSKMSLVLASQHAFDAVTEMLQSVLNCDDEISIILCHPNGGDIREYFLPQNGVMMPGVSPFMLACNDSGNNVQILDF